MFQDPHELLVLIVVSVIAALAVATIVFAVLAIVTTPDVDQDWLRHHELRKLGVPFHVCLACGTETLSTGCGGERKLVKVYEKTNPMGQKHDVAKIEEASTCQKCGYTTRFHYWVLSASKSEGDQ